jgi:hypothetical protein
LETVTVMVDTLVPLAAMLEGLAVMVIVLEGAVCVMTVEPLLLVMASMAVMVHVPTFAEAI